jgi:hypothetical protein
MSMLATQGQRNPPYPSALYGSFCGSFDPAPRASGGMPIPSDKGTGTPHMAGLIQSLIRGSVLAVAAPSPAAP